MITLPIKHFLVLVLLLFCHMAYSQKVIRFKGRLRLLEGKKQTLYNLSVRLVGQGVSSTGTDGGFAIPVKENAGSVTLEIVDGEFDIIYPIGGVIPVPKDTAIISEFIVGDSPKKLLTRALGLVSDQLKSQLKDLLDNQKESDKAILAVIAGFREKTGIEVKDVNDQVQLNGRRTEFYKELSEAINDYTNQAKDLKDAFKFITKHAFDDNQALKVLTDAIETYNVAFEKINKQHSEYEKMVNDLWQSDAKTIEVREFFIYALGELHSVNIYVLNLKTRDINDYNRGSFPGSRRVFKERILHEIEDSQLQLERRLQVLDSKAQALLLKLIT